MSAETQIRLDIVYNTEYLIQWIRRK